jgi:serine/threonine protein kinase
VPSVPGLSGLSVLARGGFATIYRAVQDSVDREVAVKVENRTLDSEHDRRRFLREAKAAGQMSSHPYVVDLHDVGVTADRHPYMIMELCDGSYAERLEAAPLTPGETRDVGVKIADALAEAHHLGVLHRDVKPANLLISRWGEPQLADFGLAVLAETRETSLTLEVVTPAYCPPETFQPALPTAAVDVYSLCASLYAMLSGRPPRWQHHRNPSIATMLDLYDQPIAELPGVPVPLLDLLRAGMANDPRARPGARQVRDRLAALPLGRRHHGAVRASAPVPGPRSPAADHRYTPHG